MYIDPKSTIAGLPALTIRGFLRRAGFEDWCAEMLADHLNLSSRKGSAVLRELTRLGYIESSPERGSACKWHRRTLAGARLALASAAKPITRETANRKVEEFLARVRAVNASDYYLYRVRRVLAFGSYLGTGERLNDIDLAVEAIHREQDNEKRVKLDLARAREARRAGRQLNTIMAEMTWSYNEVLLYLKSRSRALSLHSMEDAILERVQTKVLFQISEAPGDSRT